MKTYKVVYSIAGQLGRTVGFYQAFSAELARSYAYDGLGGFGVVSIWEVTGV